MQDIGTKEILNIINALNSEVENINSSLREISNDIRALYEFFQEYIPKLSQILQEGFWDKYGNAIFGLIGVIVGALITYAFNKMINREERISRVAIQRKNLIYAPIYKELLRLNEYIKEKARSCYINIISDEKYRDYWEEHYYHDGKRRKSGFFIVWSGMKKDVRKDYIPVKIQESLEKINKKLNAYIKNKNKINSDFKIAFNNSKINEIYGEADRKKFNKPKADSKIDLDTPAFLFKKDSNPSEGLEEVYKRWHTFREDKEYSGLRKELKRFFTNIPKEIDRKEFFKSYEELVTSIFEAKEKISELIKHIVNKYEYGEELEKIR